MNRPLERLLKSGNDELVRGVLPVPGGPGDMGVSPILY